MKTQLIAFTTATAIALTGMTAAPAQASPEDNLIRFLLGAAIIGALVNESNKGATVRVARSGEPPAHTLQKAQDTVSAPTEFGAG